MTKTMQKQKEEAKSIFDKLVKLDSTSLAVINIKVDTLKDLQLLKDAKKKQKAG